MYLDIYVDDGDVVQEGAGAVALVHDVTVDLTVLFQTADGAQAVFTGDDTEVGNVGTDSDKRYHIRVLMLNN